MTWYVAFHLFRPIKHSRAASMVFTRTGVFKEMGVAQMQDPLYREGRIMGLNTAGYTLYYRSGIDRPRARILAGNMNIWSYRDSLTGIL